MTHINLKMWFCVINFTMRWSQWVTTKMQQCLNLRSTVCHTVVKYVKLRHDILHSKMDYNFEYMILNHRHTKTTSEKILTPKTTLKRYQVTPLGSSINSRKSLWFRDASADQGWLLSKATLRPLSIYDIYKLVYDKKRKWQETACFAM